MTNAEKYKEVFGFPPDYGNCPTEWCCECPITTKTYDCLKTSDWWNEEYKGVTNG